VKPFVDCKGNEIKSGDVLQSTQGGRQVRVKYDASMDLMVLSWIEPDVFSAGFGYLGRQIAGLSKPWPLNRDNLANSCWAKVS